MIEVPTASQSHNKGIVIPEQPTYSRDQVMDILYDYFYEVQQDYIGNKGSMYVDIISKQVNGLVIMLNAHKLKITEQSPTRVGSEQ